MKTFAKNLWPVLVFGIAAILMSFEMKPGAHSFQVLIDDKLVIERYVDRSMKVPTIQLTSNNKTIDVRYNECGRTVSGRSLTARDKADNVLKVWRFEGSTSGFKDGMQCQVKDLLALVRSHDNNVKIVYTSNDFPEGMHVFTAVSENPTAATGN